MSGAGPGWEARLRQVLGEQHGAIADEVPLDADLVEVLGLDSLAGLRLLALIEKRLQVRFPDQVLGRLRTLQQILDALPKAQGGTP